MNTISFDKHKLKLFIECYEKSVAQNKEVFVFDGNEFLQKYAKYLILHLKHKLGETNGN